MNTQHLVSMANSISSFFDSEALPGDEAAQIASHITRFWDPRMRSALIAHGAAGGEGLSEHARAAVKLLVPPGPRPT